MKISQFVQEILNKNEILMVIKGHNSGTNVRKIICNNPKLDLTRHIKFGENLSISSQDIERKQKFIVNQGP